MWKDAFEVIKLIFEVIKGFIIAGIFVFIVTETMLGFLFTLAIFYHRPPFDKPIQFEKSVQQNCTDQKDSK
jgi:hypothetical protein